MNFGICHSAFAQEDSKLVALSKQIIEAKSNAALYLPFEELYDLYFSRPAIKSEGGIPPGAGKDNKYSEFADFLKSLKLKNKIAEPFIDYYIALTRYRQLKYLEEGQIWDEYFSRGNAYRDEIVAAAKNTIEARGVDVALKVYAQLLLWEFHKGQQDVLHEQALSDLMGSVLEYAKSAEDIKPLKEAADKLLAFGEKGKSRELYRVYVNKIASSDIKDDALAGIALGFYKEGNLELAELIYDVYIERAVKSLPQEKIMPLLTGVAKMFAYQDEGVNDAFYAEKIFKKMEELGGKESFDEELIYLRAFNLEKAKEYLQAKDCYVELIKQNPQTARFEEAAFKAGIIYTYVLRDIRSGKGYFQELAKREKNVSPAVISGLYQLGLLSQWEGDYPGAKDYYNKLIFGAGEDFQEAVTLARERLKEIEEAKPIEYNLKTFLDASLKEEYNMFDRTKLDLKAHPYKVKKDETVSISSTAYTGESGCMQIEVQYLWSGDLGKEKPSTNQAAFNTSYASGATKVINLIAVSATGIIDRNIDFIDVD